MKLEVGKKYVNTRGSVVDIYAKNPFAPIYHGVYDPTQKVHDADRGILYVSYFFAGEPIPECSEATNLVREYEAPAKYSVDVWVDNKPRCDAQSSVLTDFLLGGDLNWNSTPFDVCQRHLRITVEEVVE